MVVKVVAVKPFCVEWWVLAMVFWITIPQYHHHQRFVVDHALNFYDAVYVDRMHRLLFVQFLWFQLYRMGNPTKNIELFSQFFDRCHQRFSIFFSRKIMNEKKLCTCPSESTCQAVKHGVHNKWPHGSIRISLSFSAHILHNWNVLPVRVKQELENLQNLTNDA